MQLKAAVAPHTNTVVTLTLCSFALLDLLCSPQGADTVIYERLQHKHPLNGKLKEVTQQHMEDFGSAGLRTLCLAYTELDEDAYDK